MNTAVMFSSLSGEWTTPKDLFEALDNEFHFTLDAAASDENHLCERYYTKKDNALMQPWTGTVFCNPPYGKEVGKWVIKAFEEIGGTFPSRPHADKIVLLLPSRTDTKWFQMIISMQSHGFPKVVERIWFIPGRLKFGGASNSAPFPSVVVVLGCKGGDADQTE